MIFVCVGQEYRINVFTDEVGRIGTDQVDARRIRRTEGDADIDDNPAPRFRGAVSLGIEVHPDLAATAEGKKYQLVSLQIALTSHHAPRFRFQISRSPRIRTS